MTREELTTAIVSIKVDTLTCWNIYFNKRAIGDYTSSIQQLEYLRALDIYLRVLDYYYSLDEEASLTDITTEDIQNTIEAVIACIRTFKTVYYA